MYYLVFEHVIDVLPYYQARYCCTTLLSGTLLMNYLIIEHVIDALPCYRARY